MKKEIKKLWIDALRSGKYKQGREQLKIDGDKPKYCCLGVLCELAIKEGAIKSYNGERGILPRSVQKWAGIDATGEISGVLTPYDSLIEANDGGKRFTTIAGYIERYF